MNNNLLKEAVISVSLSNLLHIGMWRAVIFPKPDYFLRFGPLPVDYLGLMLSVVITAGLFYTAASILRYFYKGDRPLLKWAFLIVVVISINVVRMQFQNFAPWYLSESLLAVLGALALIILLYKWREFAFRAAVAVVLIASPFIFLTFSQAILGIIDSDKITREIPIPEQLLRITSRTGEEPKSRVIWIVFDAFDYRVPFEADAVELPEFSRLEKSSLSATMAVSPAFWTMESIPALLTGRIVEKAVPLESNDAELTLADGSETKLSGLKSVFSDVRDSGWNAAVLGSYHPYCRLYKDELKICRWEDDETVRPRSLFSVISDDMVATFGRATYLTPYLPAKNPELEDFVENVPETARLAAAHTQRREDAKAIVTNKSIDFAFIHWPIPHPPARYDSKHDRFVPHRTNYVDNLILADRDFGIIRKALEDAGLWEETALIISSDHQWRTKEWAKVGPSHKFGMSPADEKLARILKSPTIPFFVKLQDSNVGVAYDRSFNTVITRKLVRAIMNGEISDSAEAAVWLDEHAENIGQARGDD